MFAATAAKTVVDTKMAQDQADAAEKSQLASYNSQMNQMQLQMQQQAEQTVDQMSERAMQAREQMARIRVAAVESGVGGASASRIEQAASIAESQDMATLGANRTSRTVQAQAEKDGIRAHTEGSLNQINRPSWIGAGLQIAGAGAQAYMGANASSTKLKASTNSYTK
jgi:hypothetical protein